ARSRRSQNSNLRNLWSSVFQAARPFTLRPVDGLLRSKSRRLPIGRRLPACPHGPTAHRSVMKTAYSPKRQRGDRAPNPRAEAWSYRRFVSTGGTVFDRAIASEIIPEPPAPEWAPLNSTTAHSGTGWLRAPVGGSLPAAADRGPAPRSL